MTEIKFTMHRPQLFANMTYLGNIPDSGVPATIESEREVGRFTSFALKN